MVVCPSRTEVSQLFSEPDLQPLLLFNISPCRSGRYELPNAMLRQLASTSQDVHRVLGSGFHVTGDLRCAALSVIAYNSCKRQCVMQTTATRCTSDRSSTEQHVCCTGSSTLVPTGRACRCCCLGPGRRSLERT